jgi:hypothetical protein
MARKRAAARAARKTSGGKATRGAARRATSRPKARTRRKATAASRRRGSVKTRPKRRSSAKAARAASTRRAPGLERERRRLREVEEPAPGPPSSLDMKRAASAARSGRLEMQEKQREHNETSPTLTGGDVDADWADAYSVGDEAPGGDNPTPDQDRVDDIGKALGVEYQDNEELRASDKIAARDKRRWELDPASSEDYRDRKR